MNINHVREHAKGQELTFVKNEKANQIAFVKGDKVYSFTLSFILSFSPLEGFKEVITESNQEYKSKPWDSLAPEGWEVF